MKKINAFTYENEDGIKVVFVPRPKKESGIQKYSFFIVDNKELTKELSKVINKLVKFDDILCMTRVIFEFIRANDEYLELQEIFIKKWGVSPEFEIISELKRVTVILEETNGIFQVSQEKNKVPITGQGKTEISAKIKALRKFFRRI